MVRKLIGHRGYMDREFVDDTTTSKRVAKDKKKVLDLLETMPIVTAVCKRVGISRATYYRWFNEDVQFRNNVEKAHKIGILLVNDKAEGNVVTAIQQGDGGMSKFWLRNNHPRFSRKPILENWELDEIVSTKNYMVLSTVGKLTTSIARMFEGIFKRSRDEKRLDILSKITRG